MPLHPRWIPHHAVSNRRAAAVVQERGRITIRATIIVAIVGTFLLLALSMWRLQKQQVTSPSPHPPAGGEQPGVSPPQPGAQPPGTGGPQRESLPPPPPPRQADLAAPRSRARKTSPDPDPAAGRPPVPPAEAAPTLPELPVGVENIPSTSAHLPGVPVPLAPPVLPSGGRVFEKESTALAEVLGRYEQAFDRLDAAAANAVWPAVDFRALARAFGRLQHQDLNFGDCTFAVSANDAAARCSGILRYARRIGDTSTKTEHHVWTIQFSRTGESWQIVRITAQ
jgi:hypothetical protein